MAVRTVSIGGTVVNGSGVLQAGVSVTATLFIPSAALAVDTAGETIELTPLVQVTDNSGAYLFNAAGSPVTGLIAPQDIRHYVSGSLVALAGCYWEITFLANVIDSPAFAYTGSTIDPATWAPSVTTLGLFKMYLGDVFGNATPVQGRQLQIAIGQNSTWTGGAGAGQNVDPGSGFPITTDSNGRAYAYLIRQSELTPSTGFYILTGLAQVIYFTVPTAYTSDHGVYSGATTYAINNVVRDPATDIPYISLTNSNTGNALTDVVHWAIYSGENITAFETPTGIPGVATWTTASLSHDSNLLAITHDPVGSPATVHDDFANLAWRTNPTALTYTPALQGGTDNPAPTYTHQIGRYFLLGKLCFVSIAITSSTMTKTTLTDNVRVSLPVAAANVSGHVSQLSARLENGTAVKVASVAETTANASYLQLRQMNAAAASALLTYGTADLGVLTNTITVIITGVFETT